MDEKYFQQQLLNWFVLHGRKDLPWQQDKSAYRVWLSEVMLQQTQVKTVIPYFNRFIGRFKDIQALAAADEDKVLQLWSGLGYYARARNLHKTAKIISQQGGAFPKTLDSLTALPGIGRSTAGAVLSIAFGISQPILDGNVRRVLCRLHGISGWPGLSSVNRQLWQISQQYTPLKNVDSYTQAMMDLGATLCTRSKPKCEQCPFIEDCAAFVSNRVAHLPEPRPKKNLPVKQLYFMLLRNSRHQYFFVKKPASGIWGGLWSLPEFESEAAINDWCLEKSLPFSVVKRKEKQRHSFSHYHLDYATLIVTSSNSPELIAEADTTAWLTSVELQQVGLPAPIKKLLAEEL